MHKLTRNERIIQNVATHFGNQSADDGEKSFFQPKVEKVKQLSCGYYREKPRINQIYTFKWKPQKFQKLTIPLTSASENSSSIKRKNSGHSLLKNKSD